jgi:parvulin-like peptidyl-prolyl isomerase
MAKENPTSTSKTLTKKHLARLEKEKRQNRVLTIGIITIVAAILVVVLVGLFKDNISNWYKTTFVQNKPVAKIGDTSITVSEFSHRVSYERYQLVSTFTTYASSYFAAFFQEQLLQVQNELDDYLQFGSDTLDQMINERALVLKAQQMGITVTDDEVEAEIQANLEYFPSGTPTMEDPTATITYYPTSTQSALQSTLTYKTPTAIPPTATPISAEEQATLDAQIAAATAAAQAQPTTAVTPTEDPTITPTATPYTYEGYTGLYSTIVSNLATNTTFTEAELREYVRTALYQRKIFLEVSKNVSPEQEMVWARHILVADETTANVVLEKLNAGGDWNAICLEYSTDTSNSSNGGDLGWFAKGTMVPAFEDAAWALEPGQTSAAIKTDYGYHIIQVLGKEVRQLTADELSTAQSAAYQKFIEDAKTEFGVTKYDIWANNVPSVPTIPTDLRISSGS